MSRLAAPILLFPLAACGGTEDLGQPPVAVLRAPSTCDIGTVITLDGSESSDPDDGIVLYRFIISDGTAAREITADRVDHTCRTAGIIGVTLEVHDVKGNRSQASARVSVRPP